MSSLNSGNIFQGLKSALPKNPRKVNNPFGTTHKCILKDATILTEKDWSDMLT